MSPLPRPNAAPGVLVRALVSLGAVSAVAAAVAAMATGRAVPGPGFSAEFATLVMIGALARRYGVALPGNGFSSYILGVTAFNPGASPPPVEMAILNAPAAPSSRSGAALLRARRGARAISWRTRGAHRPRLRTRRPWIESA